MSDLTLTFDCGDAIVRSELSGLYEPRGGLRGGYFMVLSEQGEEEDLFSGQFTLTGRPFTKVMACLTPKDLKKRVTKLDFLLDIMATQLLRQQVVTRQQVAEFFGSFPNLKNLQLMREGWWLALPFGETKSLESATIILNEIPPNSRWEQLTIMIEMGSPSTMAQKLQDFATAMSKHSNNLKILGIHHGFQGLDELWKVPDYFGLVLDCISNMSLVKLEIGSKMDMEAHWKDKFPRIFLGLQDLSITLDWKFGMTDRCKSRHIENTLRLIEQAVKANPTIQTVTLKPQIDEDDYWIKEIKKSVGLGFHIRLLNVSSFDVDNFYMRIGCLYKQFESSKKEKENPRPLTVHLSWSDTPINSYKSACKALYDHLQWSNVDLNQVIPDRKWVIVNDGHIPTKEFGLIKALIQAKESRSSASEKTIVSRMFFNLSCEPGLWVNTAIENSNRKRSLKAVGVPIEHALQSLKKASKNSLH